MALLYFTLLYVMHTRVNKLSLLLLLLLLLCSVMLLVNDQECFPGIHGNCNAMGLLSQQIKTKPTDKHTYFYRSNRWSH